MLFSAHDSTVAGTLAAFLLPAERYPVFASNILFEFWATSENPTSDNDFYVKMLLEDKSLNLGFRCLQTYDGSYRCAWPTVKKFMQDCLWQESHSPITQMELGPQPKPSETVDEAVAEYEFIVIGGAVLGLILLAFCLMRKHCGDNDEKPDVMMNGNPFSIQSNIVYNQDTA